MDAKAFYEKHGRERCEAVAKAAGTNWPYFSQLVGGHRRASPDLAERLVTASDGEMSFADLLAKPRKKPGESPSERAAA